MYDNRVIFDDPGVIAAASHISSAKNPPYGKADFYSMYPQFQGLKEIPEAIFDVYMAFALDVVNVDSWGESFKLGVSLLIAHYLTLYLDSFAPEGASAAEVVASAQMKGVIASKSVGDVSVSYDYNSAIADVSKWSGFNLTAFGNQFAALAEMFSKGGMYIW